MKRTTDSTTTAPVAHPELIEILARIADALEKLVAKTDDVESAILSVSARIEDIGGYL